MIALAKARDAATGGFTRRGACPALSAPMQTGDGLLVRLNPVAGGLSPSQLAGLCEAAHAHGNGVVEVTSRGSLQIRGLTNVSASLFAVAVDTLDIAVRTGVPVQPGVLAGLDPEEIADPTVLTDMIRAGIAKGGLEGRLGPKVSVVIDSGGRSALEEVTADVRLTAVEIEGVPAWLVAIAGDARTARTLRVVHGDEAACEATLALLSEIAALGREARARDLNDGQLSSAVDNLKAPRSVLPPSGLPASSGGSLVGLTKLRNGDVALGVALPFGHTTAELLKKFAETARALNIEHIIPAPKRTLVALCATPVQARTLRQQAETLGFVLSTDDPRKAISACSGAPACASGYIAARDLAAEIATDDSGLLDGSVHLHISGCGKGCAHPGSADLTVVGGESGAGLVVGITARDEPLAFAASDRVKLGLAGVAALVEAERREGETTARAIQRIGFPALAVAFRQGEK